MAVDLAVPVSEDTRAEPLAFADPAGRDVFWHSGSHLLAQAVKELYPDAKLAIGPAVEEGFYYDIDRDTPFAVGDLGDIEERMREIVKRDLPVVRRELPREEARRLFESRGEIYKVEMIGELPGDTVSVYEQGDFVDMCRGPHVPRTGMLGAVKLTKVAGAYWRADERNRQLSRIYGVAFPTEEGLKEHLRLLAEAEKRDHRRLGRELDLFSFHEEGGPGLAYWHPKGAVIRRVIEDFWRHEHEKAGYDLVFSPHIGKAQLWETSGHLSFYKDSMYAPIEIEGQKYYLKPMNCPFHVLMYKTGQKSYRDLPIRLCELGTVYRYERSGTLQGLLRVRGFTQDDAHIFMRPDQLTDELVQVIEFVRFMLTSFGFVKYQTYLSTRPAESIGTDEMWNLAEGSLKTSLERAGLAYEVDPGAGVFYGPKIDIKIQDSLGRAWQCSTIQVDFNLPERFDVNYIGEDGSKKRTVMIHRALLGSMERFFGALIEHYGGDFPVWLAPVQARVITITSDQEEYARGVLEKLKGAGIRAEADTGPEKMGYKIRNAELAKVPYMLVIGKREAADGKVAVRRKGKGDQGAVPVEEFISRISGETEQKA
jgi:threonyl-tRNA synthetase